MTHGLSQNLCSPGLGLSCFACCPPIRPPGYDHADHTASLRRLFSEARQEHLSGQAPGPILGFSCPGLGFLDSAGHQVGCLYHPARHGGQDLRLATGYQPKCARESCPPARAYARLPEPARRELISLCAGLDAFSFSSRRLNPLLRLLALGPRVAREVAGLGLASLAELEALAWLDQTPPALGWLLGHWLELAGSAPLARPGLAGELTALAQDLARRLGPRPPLEQGPPLEELCGEWEARFWRAQAGRRRLPAETLAAWRGLAGQVLAIQG